MEGEHAQALELRCRAVRALRSTRWALGLMGLLLTISLATAPSALAGRYQFDKTLGTPGAGDGQLSEPADVAIDEGTGTIYVADAGNHRVVSFDPQGNFAAAWGWGVDNGASESQVCASGCQAGLAGSGAGQLDTPKFIEVDNSPSQSAGDVYVADSETGLVQKFDPSGNLVSSWGDGGQLDFSGQRPLAGITVDVTGNLYVVSAKSPYYWTEISPGADSQTKIPSNNSELNGVGMQLGTPGEAGVDVSETGVFYEPQPNDPATGNRRVVFGNPNGSGGVYQNFDGDFLITGIALDRPRGHVYVGRGDHIEQFAGSCDAMLGCELTDSFGSPQLEDVAGLAVDSSAELVYAADVGAGSVAVFAPLPVPTVTTGDTIGVALTGATLTGRVDPGGGGAVSDCHFDYLTGSFRNEIQSIHVTGATGGTFTLSFKGQQIGPLPFNAGGGTIASALAFIPSSVRNAGNGASVEFVNSLGRRNLPEMTGDGSQLIPAGAQVSVTTPVEGNGWASAAAAPCAQSTLFDTPTDVSADLTGLLPLETYRYRLSATLANGGGNAGLGLERSFLTASNLRPAVDAGSAVATSPTEATITGQIDPNGLQATYHLEFGTDTTYGSGTAFEQPVGGDDTPQPVNATLPDLLPKSVYHVRIVATNLNGPTRGPDQSFTTPGAPSIELPNASDITTTSARLSAQVTPWLRPTTVHFEYGSSAAYGSSTPPVSAGADSAPHDISVSVSSLTPSTAYHYRGVATNTIGSVVGPDQTFTTAPALAPKTLTPPRKTCKRGFIRKHGKCVKKHRKHTGHKRGKRNHG
jgi:NHL repeat